MRLLAKPALILTALLSAPAGAQPPPPATSGYKVALRDGRVLFAKEPPKVKGRTAIVKLADGTLLSVSSAEIDESATQAANAAPVPMAPTPTPVPRPTARLRLTTDDIPSRSVPTLDSWPWGAHPTAGRASSSSTSDDGLDFYRDGDGQELFAENKAFVSYGYRDGKLAQISILFLERCGSTKGRLERAWGKATSTPRGELWMTQRTSALLHHEGCMLQVFDSKALGH
jgi:hypothetical protein